MNKKTVDFGSEYLIRTCVLFLACLVLPTAVLAVTPQMAQQRDSSGQSVSLIVETAAVSGKDDAVIALDGEATRSQLLSVAFISSDMGFRGGSVSTESVQNIPDSAGRGQMETSERSDNAHKMPYSLVLALIALIGLVPVSRRNR